MSAIHVDDDDEFLDLATTVLERSQERLRIIPESNPEKVLNLLKLKDIDCVISDYDMPGMDGIELLEAVREEHPRLPFILLTGQGSEAVAGRAIELNVTNYQRKKGNVKDLELLAQLVSNSIDGYRAHQMAAKNEAELIRYQRLVEMSDHLYTAMDRKGNYLLANDQYLRYHDRERHEVEGKHIKEVLSEETIERLKPFINRVLSGEHVRFQMADSRPGAGDCIFDIQYYPLRDSHDYIEGFVAEMRDITRFMGVDEVTLI